MERLPQRTSPRLIQKFIEGLTLDPGLYVPPEDIEKAFRIDRTESVYGLLVLHIRTAIEADSERMCGRQLGLRQVDYGLQVMTSAEAAQYYQAAQSMALSKFEELQQRAHLVVNRDELDEHERRRFDHQMRCNAKRILSLKEADQGMIEEVSRE